jgi:hypothetical protein
LGYFGDEPFDLNFLFAMMKKEQKSVTFFLQVSWRIH